MITNVSYPNTLIRDLFFPYSVTVSFKSTVDVATFDYASQTVTVISTPIPPVNIEFNKLYEVDIC